MIAIPSLLIILAAFVCSVFGCAMPFAAISALAAVHLRSRTGIAIVAGSWLLNQALGFTVHHYPTDPTTLAWAAALGVASFVAFAFARAWRDRPLVAVTVAFLAFEGILVLTSLRLGGWEDYAPAIIAMLAAVNVAWFLGVHMVSNGINFYAARR